MAYVMLFAIYVPNILKERVGGYPTLSSATLTTRKKVSPTIFDRHHFLGPNTNMTFSFFLRSKNSDIVDVSSRIDYATIIFSAKSARFILNHKTCFHANTLPILGMQQACRFSQTDLYAQAQA